MTISKVYKILFCESTTFNSDEFMLFSLSVLGRLFHSVQRGSMLCPLSVFLSSHSASVEKKMRICPGKNSYFQKKKGPKKKCAALISETLNKNIKTAIYKIYL